MTTGNLYTKPSGRLAVLTVSKTKDMVGDRVQQGWGLMGGKQKTLHIICNNPPRDGGVVAAPSVLPEAVIGLSP